MRASWQRGEDAAWGGDPAWIAVAETVGPWLLLGVAAALVASAFARRRRYAAVDVLNAADQEKVHQALREAERRTVGEIVPVVVERSDPHPAGLWLAALAAALLGSALLEGLLPWSHPPLLLLCQIGLGAAGALAAALLPDLHRRFVFQSRADGVADEQAFQEFYRLGLHHTEGGTGVLLFVSLFERRVVVLADRGISEKVDAEQWQATRDAILRGIRDGSLCQGLVAGIGHAGELLAQQAPWQHGDRNQIPDRLIVRRQ